MKKKRKSWKFKGVNLKGRQLQTCMWFAEMNTPSEVAAKVSETYGIQYTRQAAYDLSKLPKWRKVITYLKKKILNDLAATPIANKAIRLKALQGLYETAMTKSLKSQNRYGKIYELKLTVAIAAIQTAREEMEGKKSSLMNVEDGGKLVFQDIKIEGRPLGELLKDINARLSSQFTC